MGGFGTSGGFEMMGSFGATGGFDTTAGFGNRAGFGMMGGFDMIGGFGMTGGFDTTAGFCTAGGFGATGGFDMIGGFGLTGADIFFLWIMMSNSADILSWDISDSNIWCPLARIFSSSQVYGLSWPSSEDVFVHARDHQMISYLPCVESQP